MTRSTLDIGICDSHNAAGLVGVLPMWKPFRVGDYWQCATPTGPYNFQAVDEFAAIGICERERAHPNVVARTLR